MFQPGYPILFPQKIQAGAHPAVRAQFEPSALELDPTVQEGGLADPIGDEAAWQAPQLIHRYRNRALFLATKRCAVICRHCFRKNSLSTESDLYRSDFDLTLDYLRAHPEIEEIIWSGGDPLMISDTQLSLQLGEFSKISHLKFFRFHTRVPVVAPERVTRRLVDLLVKYKAMICIHTNHVAEWSAGARACVEQLHRAGIRLLSQTVLLNGINDSVDELEALFRCLQEIHIEPYYLHHPDRAKGAMHFWLSEDRGRSIFSELRQRLPGWMLPTYVIDHPDAHGKSQL